MTEKEESGTAPLFFSAYMCTFIALAEVKVLCTEAEFPMK